MQLDVDGLALVPAEGYGEARAVYSYQPGVMLGRDDFTGRTTGTTLGGTAGQLGGTWTTSGSTTDFTAADGPGATDETITRSTTSDSASGRLAILGTTTLTNTEVGVSYRGSAEVGGSRHHGVVARYVDASNYLRLSHQSTTSVGDVWVEAVIGGVATQILEMGYAMTVDRWFKLRLVVFSTGYGVATWLSANGAVLDSKPFQHSALATGGVLATGKVGIIDRNGSAFASTRYYDDFYAATPAAEPIVCHAGQSIEFRHDGVLREDASGTYWGPAPSYRGARFTIPPAGTRNRKTRIAVVARRNDTRVQADDNVTDSTTVQVIYQPRWLVVPR